MSVLFHAKFFYSETDYSFKNFRQIHSIPGLQLDNQIVVVHDAGANMRKATQNSDVVDIALLCIDHQIQLVIQDSISSVPEVEAEV